MLMSNAMPCQWPASPPNSTFAPLQSHTSDHRDFPHSHCFCTNQDMMGVIITTKLLKNKQQLEKKTKTKVTMVPDCSAFPLKPTLRRDHRACGHRAGSDNPRLCTAELEETWVSSHLLWRGETRKRDKVTISVSDKTCSQRITNLAFLTG